MDPEYKNYTCGCKLPPITFNLFYRDQELVILVHRRSKNQSLAYLAVKAMIGLVLSRIQHVQLAGTRLMHVAARSSRKIDVHGWCSSQIHGSCIYQLAQLSQDRRTRPNGEAHDLLKTRSTTLLYTARSMARRNQRQDQH